MMWEESVEKAGLTRGDAIPLDRGEDMILCCKLTAGAAEREVKRTLQRRGFFGADSK